MKQCLVSVIVPTYNSESTLTECLQSITQIMLYENNQIELIVSDDGSTDSSLNIAQGYKAKIVASQGNQGAAHARNMGAKAARGDYLLFIDSDVVLLSKDILRHVVNGFANNDICGISGCYDEKIMFNDFCSSYKHLYMCFQYLNAPRLSFMVSSAIMSVPRKLFEKSGGFNEAFTTIMAEDIEYSLKLALMENKPFLVDLEIKGRHLKKYNIIDLLKADYLRTKGISLILRNEKARKIYSKTVGQNIVLLALLPNLAGIIWASLFRHNILLLLFLLLFFYIVSTQNKPFAYFRRRKGLLFAFFSISFYFIEIYYVALCALCLQLLNKENNQIASVA